MLLKIRMFDKYFVYLYRKTHKKLSHELLGM